MNGKIFSHGLTSTPQKSQGAFDLNSSYDASSAYKLVRIVYCHNHIALCSNIECV